MLSIGGCNLEAILLEYAWVLVVLIVLEGLLAADNAVVMAVMVKHLPRINRRKHFSTDCSVRLFSALRHCL